MGYSTTLHGIFELDKPLTPARQRYLMRFSETRRVARDPAQLPPDPLRTAVRLPPGEEGGYFVGVRGHDQDHWASVTGAGVLDGNRPPSGQPGLWCQWIPNEDGTAIVWDGGEKFYAYTAWIRYLIEHFLGPWGYVLNGDVQWQGEDEDDRGIIRVVDNVVSELWGHTIYAGEDGPTLQNILRHLVKQYGADFVAVALDDVLSGGRK